jgi:hypothetical protein
MLDQSGYSVHGRGWLVIKSSSTGWSEPRRWMVIGDLVVLSLGTLSAVSLTFTPALVITPQEIRRRWRSPIRWTEVVEILPPGRFGRGMRLRLNDRAVIELPQVGADRGDALMTMAGIQRAR